MNALTAELRRYQEEKNVRYRTKEVRQIYTMLELQARALQGLIESEE